MDCIFPLGLEIQWVSVVTRVTNHPSWSRLTTGSPDLQLEVPWPRKPPTVGSHSTSFPLLTSVQKERRDTCSGGPVCVPVCVGFVCDFTCYITATLELSTHLGKTYPAWISKDYLSPILVVSCSPAWCFEKACWFLFFLFLILVKK